MRTSSAIFEDRHTFDQAPSTAPEQLLAVAELSRELSRGGSFPEPIERALAVLDRRLGVARAVVYRAHTERRSLQIEATHGLPAEALRPRFGTGVAGRVAETGLPIVVPELRHDAMGLSDLEDWSTWQGDDWSVTAVAFPLSTATVGVLVAYFKTQGQAGFSAQLSVLEVVASLLTDAWPRLAGKEARPKAPAAASARAGPPTTSRGVFEYANMVGASAAMRQVYEQIGQVARTNATTLLRGESGTGKEVVAHAIHHNSPRAAAPFVKINCAALPEPLFESELFGHERGAFTGAHGRKKGRFELANGGTLFLDEVGELSPSAQAKLLRVLQFREFERLGGTETLHCDVRLIAATNKDLEGAVAAGTFREDLYYRLNIFTIPLPPLRDRRADIPALAEYFLARFAAEHQRRIGRISSGAVEVLTHYFWPGNVRELENVIERAVVVCDEFVIQEHHLPSTLRKEAEAPQERLTLGAAVERLERRMIKDALEAENGNVARAARVLGTTERILRYKAIKYGLVVGRHRS